MEEKHSCDQSGQPQCSKSCCGVAPFFVGIVLALVVGWWIFPKALFSQENQPVRFSHPVHVEDGGMACEDCHYFNEDGTYNGLPNNEKCGECHSEAMGEDPAETKYIDKYLSVDKEVPWLVYQKQPDNVFFSHAVHNMDKCGECHDFSEVALCNHCHPNVAEADTPPAFNENRLTGYSKDTMKMWACEECHAIPEHRENTNANNACFTCHK